MCEQNGIPVCTYSCVRREYSWLYVALLYGETSDGLLIPVRVVGFIDYVVEIGPVAVVGFMDMVFVAVEGYVERGIDVEQADTVYNANGLN
jgi:hypothetical protein